MALQHGLQRDVELRRHHHGREHLPFALPDQAAQLPQPVGAQLAEIMAVFQLNDLNHAEDAAVLAHQHRIFDKVAARLRLLGQDRDGRAPVLRVERQPRELSADSSRMRE